MSFELEDKKTPTPNPLLAKLKLPGRMFPLPSRALCYTDEVSESCKATGEVQVMTMSALAEIKMKSADLLYSGKAIEEVFLECIPDIKKPMALAQQDIDALLMYLRIVTYGEQLEIETEHTCDDAKLHKYPFNLDALVGKTDGVMLTKEQWEMAYQVTLSNGQRVRLRPRPFSTMIHLIQETQLAVKGGTLSAEDAQKLFILQMVASIQSVDDVNDPEMINQWVRQIKPKMRTAIMNQLEEANKWGFNLKPSIACKDCGVNFDYELPLNPVNFFSE